MGKGPKNRSEKVNSSKFNHREINLDVLDLNNTLYPRLNTCKLGEPNPNDVSPVEARHEKANLDGVNIN